MQNIQKSRDRVASCFSNLCLLNQSLVEEVDGTLLIPLLVRVAPSIATLGFLLGCRTRDVEPHLDELILPSRSLLALPWRRAILAVGLGSLVDGKLDGDFVTAGKVRVGDLGVGNFESGPVLYVERHFGLAELCLSPVPAAQGMLLALEVGAVPVLENFAQALVILPPGQLPPCASAAVIPTSCWKPSSWIRPEFLCRTFSS